MDLEKLRRDQVEDPALQDCSYGTVEELAEFLTAAHKYLVSEKAGPLAYLYRNQIARVRELQKELDRVRNQRQHPPGRR